MASVVKRKRKSGEASWYARFRDGSGRDRWVKCASAKDAKAYAAEAEVQLGRSAGTWAPPERLTIREYSETWQAQHGPTLRPRTRATYQRVLERDLLPFFGDVLLAALTRSQVKAYMAKRAAAGAAANTVRNSIAPLRSMLSSALEDGLVRENVCLRLPRVGEPARQIKAPTAEQVQAVIAAADEQARGPIILAASTGLRRGEVFGLRWSDVEFDRRLLHIRVANVDGVISKPKTAAGERIVPMFGSVRTLLLETKARSPFKAPTDYVFPGPTGAPMSPNGWLKWHFYPALRAAGVEPFRLHDLRHFAVSQLIAQGADVLQVSRVAGHADPSITLRVYSHLMPDGLAAAAASYDPLEGLSEAAPGRPAVDGVVDGAVS